MVRLIFRLQVVKMVVAGGVSTINLNNDGSQWYIVIFSCSCSENQYYYVCWQYLEAEPVNGESKGFFAGCIIICSNINWKDASM